MVIDKYTYTLSSVFKASSLLRAFQQLNAINFIEEEDFLIFIQKAENSTLFTNFPWIFIHNCQNLEATKIPFTVSKTMIEGGMCIYLYNEILLYISETFTSKT